jgi:hypothetical protein
MYNYCVGKRNLMIVYLYNNYKMQIVIAREKGKSETKAVGSTKQYQDFFIWQAIVRGQSVSTEGPFLFLACLICYFRQFF